MAPTKITAKYIATKADHTVLPTKSGMLMMVNTELKFTGEMDGVATMANVMTQNGTDTCSLTYDGQELFTGSIADKKGSVVLRLSGHISNGVCYADLTVVPGSGTDELRHLTGSGSYQFACGSDTDPLKTTVDVVMEVEWE